MRLLAQHGHQPSDKITRGVAEGIIQGAILSPRYVGFDRVAEKVAEIRGANAGAGSTARPGILCHAADWDTEQPVGLLGRLGVSSPRNAAGTWSGGRQWKGRCEAFMMPCPDWMCRLTWRLIFTFLSPLIQWKLGLL